MALSHRFQPARLCVLLAGDLRQLRQRRWTLRLNLQSDPAHRHRLRQEPTGHVAVRGALVGSDGVALLAEAAIHLCRALRPLRIARLKLLDLQIKVECKLMFASCRRCGGVIAELATILGRHLYQYRSFDQMAVVDSLGGFGQRVARQQPPVDTAHITHTSHRARDERRLYFAQLAWRNLSSHYAMSLRS